MQFSVPLRVKVSKNKHFILNMNNYRNTHHRVLSCAKRNFTDYVLNLDLPKKKFDRLQVTYHIYPATNRRYDIMNVISVVDKFLMDALIKRGIIDDDSTKYVVMPKAVPCQVDRENPRIDVELAEF